MNFETRKFTYVKADGSRSEREVFVIAENDNYLQGIDLARVSSSDRSKVLAMKGEIQKTVGKNSTPPTGFDKKWNDAWRLFKKSGIRK